MTNKGSMKVSIRFLVLFFLQYSCLSAASFPKIDSAERLRRYNRLKKGFNILKNKYLQDQHDSLGAIKEMLRSSSAELDVRDDAKKRSSRDAQPLKDNIRVS